MRPRSIAVIQARMGSTRLPGKILRPLAGRSVLGWVVRAATLSGAFDEIIVATTDSPADDATVEEADALSVRCTRGPEDDVLSRFVGAITTEDDDTTLVRLTADCPLLDPAVISMCVRAFDQDSVDYLSTVTPRSLPRGLDVEVTTVGMLRMVDRVAVGPDRIHVTSHLYREMGRYRTAGLTFQPGADDLRVTLDTPEDWALLTAVVDEIGDRAPGWRDLVRLLRAREDLAAINARVVQKPMEAG